MAGEKEVRKKINELLNVADRANDAAARNVIKLLAQARKDVAAAVASTDWQIFYLPQLKAATERALSDFGSKFKIELNDFDSEMWGMGTDMIDLPLRQIGMFGVIPEINTQALHAIQEFGLSKIEGMAMDVAQKIKDEISLGLMGNKSPYEVMQKVGRNLEDKSIFTSAMKRSETIVFNEGKAALETASQKRKEAAAQIVPGLQKQWYYGHSPKMPRLDHLAANGQIVDIDKPFLIGGEELMFPRDPAGSPGNTINCG